MVAALEVVVAGDDAIAIDRGAVRPELVHTFNRNDASVLARSPDLFRLNPGHRGPLLSRTSVNEQDSDQRQLETPADDS